MIASAAIVAGAVIGVVVQSPLAVGAATTLSTAAKVTNPLPSVSVTDVRTGKSVNLASVFSGKKPLLVWFWAPH